MQSGQAANALLVSSVSVINGFRNFEASFDGVSAADPGFLRVVTLMRKIQLSGAMGLSVLLDADSGRSAVVTFRSANIDQQTLAHIHEIRDLLGLDQEAHEFHLVYGRIAADNREIAVQSRALLGIMQMMSAHVDVPHEQVSDGRATPGLNTVQARGGSIPALSIRYTADRPSDSFVSVSYRNHWFWIDDKDLRTKRVFATLMLLFSLADKGATTALPTITIPAHWAAPHSPIGRDPPPVSGPSGQQTILIFASQQNVACYVLLGETGSSGLSARRQVATMPAASMRWER